MTTRIKFTPTKTQIRQACAAIQSSWTEAERLRRQGFRIQHWNVPILEQAWIQLQLADQNH